MFNYFVLIIFSCGLVDTSAAYHVNGSQFPPNSSRGSGRPKRRRDALYTHLSFWLVAGSVESQWAEEKALCPAVGKRATSGFAAGLSGRRLVFLYTAYSVYVSIFTTSTTLVLPNDIFIYNTCLELIVFNLACSWRCKAPPCATLG